MLNNAKVISLIVSLLGQDSYSLVPVNISFSWLASPRDNHELLNWAWRPTTLFGGLWTASPQESKFTWSLGKLLTIFPCWWDTHPLFLFCLVHLCLLVDSHKVVATIARHGIMVAVTNGAYPPSAFAPRPLLKLSCSGQPAPCWQVSTFCVINDHSLFYCVTICTLFRLSISVLNNAKVIGLIVHLLRQTL